MKYLARLVSQSSETPLAYYNLNWPRDLAEAAQCIIEGHAQSALSSVKTVSSYRPACSSEEYGFTHEIKERLVFIQPKLLRIYIRKDLGMRDKPSRKSCLVKEPLDIQSEQSNMVFLAVEEQSILGRLQERIFKCACKATGERRLANETSARFEDSVDLA